jgi:hypothetical protein
MIRNWLFTDLSAKAFEGVSQAPSSRGALRDDPQLTSTRYNTGTRSYAKHRAAALKHRQAT